MTDSFSRIDGPDENGGRRGADSLSGQVAVVTGAGRGIGRAIAERLARRGVHVVVNDLDADAVQDVANGIGGTAAPGDAASLEGVRALIGTAREVYGEIDIYFANAGIEVGSKESDADWGRSWDVNVMAHVRAFRELRDPWLARGGGRFIVTVSAAGLLTMIGSPAYSATKHAALAHAEWLAITHGDANIVVQALCPQGVRTGMLPTDPVSQTVLGDSVMEPEAVAATVLEALEDDRFLILPHSDVADYYRARAADPDRWIGGMRKLHRRATSAT